MKKMVIAALTAAALIFGFASCGSTSGEDNNAAFAAALEAEKKANAPKLPAGAVAHWDFSKLPADGIITDAYKTFDADLAIPAMEGSEGATFTLLAGSETKYLKGEESPGGAPFLAHNNRGSATLEALENSKAIYTLTLDKPGSVAIVVSGNGDASPSRICAITDANGTIIAAQDQLSKSPAATVEAKNLAAGTYTVYMSGSRLHKITVSK